MIRRYHGRLHALVSFFACEAALHQFPFWQYLACSKGTKATLPPYGYIGNKCDFRVMVTYLEIHTVEMLLENI